MHPVLESTCAWSENHKFTYTKRKLRHKILLSNFGIHMQSRETIQNLFQELNLPLFRLKQLYEAVYKQGIVDYDQMTVLPLTLRQTLSRKLRVLCLTPVKTQKSVDGMTEKVLFELISKDRIETVLMRFMDGRNSVCISCQAGCAMGCMFCATGKLKLTHNLTAEEIVDQVLYFHAQLKKEDQNITNIVFMGMGEPFANYDNVMKAIAVLTSPDYFHFSPRRITISTCGIIPGIHKLLNEPYPVNLAISLHAPTQGLREKIMPIAKAWPLDQLLDAVRQYFHKTHRRVSFEYILLKGINDSPHHAEELAEISDDKMIHVNLIPYNNIDIEGISGSEKKTVLAFKNSLQKRGVNATVRVTMGQDISAACGQLANKK